MARLPTNKNLEAMKPFATTLMNVLILLLLPMASTAQTVAAPAALKAAWTAADYGRFTPGSFRGHGPAQQVMDRENIDQALLNAALFFATNAERLRHKLPPFQSSRALTQSAFQHSRDMALQGFFSHQNLKDAAKRTPWKRMAAQGVSGGRWAENIAIHNARGATYLDAADALLSQWMNSPGHRSNILNPKLTYLGCGAHFCRSEKMQIYATQNFATAVPGVGSP